MGTLTFVYGDSDLLVHQKVCIGKLQRKQFLLAENERQPAVIAKGGGWKMTKKVSGEKLTKIVIPNAHTSVWNV